jgi:SAM-dependent methyltransferase
MLKAMTTVSSGPAGHAPDAGEQHPVFGHILHHQRQLTLAALKDFVRQRNTPVTVACLGCRNRSIALDLLTLPGVQSLLAVDTGELLNRLTRAAIRLDVRKKLRIETGRFHEVAWGSGQNFDVIVSIDMLHSLPYLPSVLTDIRKRLKNEGIFIGNLRSEAGQEVFLTGAGFFRRRLISLQPLIDHLLPSRSVLRNWLGKVGYFRTRTYGRLDAERLLLDADFQLLSMDSGAYHWFAVRKTPFGITAEGYSPRGTTDEHKRKKPQMNTDEQRDSTEASDEHR